MKFQDFLSAGIRFDQSEEDLEFRIRFFNAVALIAIVASIMFIVLDIFDIRWMDGITRRCTEAEALVSLLLILHLRGRKHAYRRCAWALLLMSYLVFSSALLFISKDELRPVWFLIWVVAAYVMLGQHTGLATTIVSIVTVLSARFLAGVAISSDALYTFLLTLSVASGMTWAYTSVANSYFQKIGQHLRQLGELASKDPLTNLWNLRFFSDASNKLFAISQRNNTPVCLLFIDLDHFKTINDNYGHQVGDIVLCEVARLLSTQLRKSDLIGRIGGEEFVVLMPDTDLHGATTLAEKLRSTVAAQSDIIPGAAGQTVHISIGVTTRLAGDASVVDMQKRADAAMYQAKKQGRNRVVRALG